MCLVEHLQTPLGGGGFLQPLKHFPKQLDKLINFQSVYNISMSFKLL